ncbi:hypothetical protein K402DRAFT_390418 [Aulographum hederae CBS 113979]|uniref:FAD-binding FR-type domain-containing protein n=1 Tax=Aulographum hederae CBS 113979 TaxID=1176131 RepID=A0A6G1HAN7_9PEZI|nr:hypothetical protein K402DRAFT_390418 [Aulographum hederae CBS 113979]
MVGTAIWNQVRIAREDRFSSLLNPSEFTPYRLKKVEYASSNSSLFTLRAPRRGSVRWDDGGENDEDTEGEKEDGEGELRELLREAWKRGVWSVQIKQPQLQIARSYTPLPPITSTSPPTPPSPSSTTTTTKSTSTSSTADLPPVKPIANPSSVSDIPPQETDLRFYIRQHTSGELSRYLHAIPPNERVFVRGPYLELEIPEHVEEVVFIAGGTGIAPAMQIADLMARRERGGKLTVLWACRMRDECAGGVSASESGAGVEGGAGSGQHPPSSPSSWRNWLSLTNPSPPPPSSSPRRKSPIVTSLESLQSRLNAHPTAPTSSLHIEYFVDAENKMLKPASVLKHLKNGDGSLKQGTEGARMIVVSGPEGFVNLWAGPKMWAGGKEVQGGVGGWLRGLAGEGGEKGWRVWKL